MALIPGLDPKPIRRGREEGAESLASRPPDRVRWPGGGRQPVEQKTRKESVSYSNGSNRKLRATRKATANGCESG